MIRKAVYLACFWAISCSDADRQRPEYVLSPEQLAAVKTDMYLIEAAQNIRANKPGDTTLPDYITQYEFVFKQHQTNAKQVDSSIRYYAAQPDKLIEIYRMVADSIDRRKLRAIKH